MATYIKGYFQTTNSPSFNRWLEQNASYEEGRGWDSVHCPKGWKATCIFAGSAEHVAYWQVVPARTPRKVKKRMKKAVVSMAGFIKATFPKA